MTVEGVVIRAHGKSFVVRTEDSEIVCEIRGKVRQATRGDTPVAVGDDVTVSVGPEGDGSIEKVLSRRTMFFRPSKSDENKRQIIAANIDQLAVVASVTEPALKTGMIDRFLIAAEIGNLKPIVIINKVDLNYPPILDEIERGYMQIEIPVFFVSARTGEGIKHLEESLVDSKTVFVGHSGVGKSTILNWLLPGKDLRVGEISDYSKKGIHTTSSVELFKLPNGGYVLDSPGLKVLGLWEVQKSQLDSYFKDIRRYHSQCRFAGCSHTHEPDCAVKKAVEAGEIAAFRYRNYLTIYNSL